MERKMLGSALILGLVLIWTVAGCGSRPSGELAGEGTLTMKIGYLPITHSLPLVAAQERKGGGFRNPRVEPVKFSSWPELTEALNAGKIDGAVTMLELAAVGRQKGFPLKVVALSHRNGDVLVARKGISSVKELAGKTIAIPHRLSGHNILLYKALKDAGLTYGDITYVEMPPPDMMSALARKEVDAYVVAEPFGAASVIGGFGEVLLRAQDIWPGWICCGLVMREEVISKNPGAVRELVAAVQEAGRALEEDREEALRVAEKHFGHRRELMDQSLDWISYRDLVPEPGELVAVQDYLNEMGLMKGVVSPEELLDARFVTGEGECC